MPRLAAVDERRGADLVDAAVAADWARKPRGCRLNRRNLIQARSRALGSVIAARGTGGQSTISFTKVRFELLSKTTPGWTATGHAAFVHGGGYRPREWYAHRPCAIYLQLPLESVLNDGNYIDLYGHDFCEAAGCTRSCSSLRSWQAKGTPLHRPFHHRPQGRRYTTMSTCADKEALRNIIC